MAPLEELHSKDLAWISDFVMQQVVRSLTLGLTLGFASPLEAVS